VLCARSIQPFEGSRSGLRRARAYANSIGGKCVFGDAPGMSSGVENATEIERESLNAQMCLGRMSRENGKRDWLDKKTKREGASRSTQKIS